VWVKAGSANIRNGPSTQNKVIAGAKWNDKLLVIEEQGKWYKVKLPQGQIGWIYQPLCSSEKLYYRVKTKPEETKPTLEDLTMKLSFIRINKEVKNSLHFYYYNRMTIFGREFGITFSPDLPFDSNYERIIEGFHDRREKYGRESLYGKLVRYFGRETAENIIWLLDHWELWEKFCK
ncbi:unnamed protein product, partial [marine sediment metagenome]